MRTKISCCLLPYILFLMASCTKVVDLEHLRPEPKLVLNCVASAGEPLKASLSRTWFYTDNYPNVTIGNARLNLYVNDRFVQVMNWEEEQTEYYAIGNYVSSYIPAVGDKIRVEAERKGFKSVAGEDTVLPAPHLIDVSARELNRSGSSTISKRELRVRFKDPQEAGNCYLIRFLTGTPFYEHEDNDWDKPYVYTGKYHWSTETPDYTTDPLFETHITALDKVLGNDWLSGYNGRPFSDEMINGKEYTIRMEYSSYSYNYIGTSKPLPDSLRVYLYSVSESYYKYFSAVTSLNDGSLSNDLANAGLAEPVRVFSNIEGGLGIMGTVCVDSLTVAVAKAD